MVLGDLESRGISRIFSQERQGKKKRDETVSVVLYLMRKKNRK
jgi:hypothetical protein